MLSPENRSKLNEIIGRMKDNQEPDEAIREMVKQFRAKYDTPEVPAKPQGPGFGDLKRVENQEMDEGWRSPVFPSAGEIQGDGFIQGTKRVGMGTLDVLGALDRGAAALTSGQKMSDPDSYPLRPVIDAAKPVIGQAASGMDAFGNELSPEMADRQREQVQRIQDKAEFLGRLISPTILGGPAVSAIRRGVSSVSGGLRKAGEAIASAPNRIAGRLAEEMSGVSEEALRKAGTKEGRATLEAAHGRQDEIGQQLLDRIDNADEYMTERQAVDKALKGMPNISLEDAIQALEEAKVKPEAGRIFPHEVAANAKIDTYIDALRGGKAPPDMAGIAQGARNRVERTAAEIEDIAQLDQQAAQEARQAAQGQKAARSEMGQAAARVGALKRQGTDFGWWHEEALSTAREAAKKAREASNALETASAVKGIRSEELAAAKATLQGANRAYAVADGAAQLYHGTPLQQVAKELSRAHGLKGADLKEVLSKAKSQAESVPAAPNLEVTAPEYRNLRRKLDVNIDFNSEDGKIVNSALKSGRGTMKDKLIAVAEASGNPEYAAQMRSWSDKLDKLERIKSLLGKTGAVRDRRIESFISNLFGKNSKHKQQLMQDLDQIFGSNMTGEAKDAFLAAQLGEEGKATLLPRQVTGRAALGYVVGNAAAVPFMSPAIASRLTLPLAEKLEAALRASGGVLTDKGTKALKALEKADSKATQIKLIQIIEKESGGNVIPFRMKQVAERDEEKNERVTAGE